MNTLYQLLRLWHDRRIGFALSPCEQCKDEFKHAVSGLKTTRRMEVIIGSSAHRSYGN